MIAKVAALGIAASLTLVAYGNCSVSHAGAGTTAQASARTYVTLPPSTTWTASSGATDVPRFHETGATFTGTEAAGGFNAKLSGAITGPGQHISPRQMAAAPAYPAAGPPGQPHQRATDGGSRGRNADRSARTPLAAT
jgi:hypothetical protein